MGAVGTSSEKTLEKGFNQQTPEPGILCKSPHYESLSYARSSQERVLAPIYKTPH